MNNIFKIFCAKIPLSACISCRLCALVSRATCLEKGVEFEEIYLDPCFKLCHVGSLGLRNLGLKKVPENSNNLLFKMMYAGYKLMFVYEQENSGTNNENSKINSTAE